MFSVAETYSGSPCLRSQYFDSSFFFFSNVIDSQLPVRKFPYRPVWKAMVPELNYGRDQIDY